MIVAIHQPDLLPYSGFWFKMATSDVFVLAVHDQVQKHGYQRRVRMRETWVSHQLVGKPSLVPISAVQVQHGWQGRLADAIRGRSAGRPGSCSTIAARISAAVGDASGRPGARRAHAAASRPAVSRRASW